jgi:hypothetical protein
MCPVLISVKLIVKGHRLSHVNTEIWVRVNCDAGTGFGMLYTFLCVLVLAKSFHLSLIVPSIT